jgi:recombination protein RecR
MNPIDRLAELFSHFPGIGERQAKRFVYFLLLQDQGYLNSLAQTLTEIKKSIGQCSQCYRYFQINGKVICNECAEIKRDDSLLLVVEKDADLESIKKSGSYNGRYFVLGGLVPIVEKSTPRRVRINELKTRIQKDKDSGVLKEVILAFSLSPQGDHTDTYVRESLNSLFENTGIELSSLGRGLSTGTELEYSDRDTMNALKNRG